jgi:predicted AAA+ superfamily ATPase
MFTRHTLPLLNDALADTPVVLLNGARQTGKSTLAQSLSESRGRQYFTLDDHVTLAAVKNDPTGFIAGLRGAVTLDEVQRAPELFLAIKAAVDRDRCPGRFLLTGSTNVLLLPDIADSLAGRMEILSLWPLSAAEMVDAPTFNLVDWLFDGDINDLNIAPCERAQLIEKLLCGGFPEAVSRTAPKRRSAWFNSYLQAVMQRDMRDLANIEQLTEIPNLLQLLATRSASLLNFAEISRSSGLTQTTLKRYFSLLETLFLVYRLPAWERNLSKRLVKAPKVFLPDSGLLAHLMDISSGRLNSATGLPGGLVETFVVSELLKHLAFSEKQLSAWHYRTQSNIEVDVILENRLGKLTGIEIKASHSVSSKDFNGLRHLKETEAQSFQRGIVLYSGRDVVPFAADLFAVPLSMWWSRPTR